MFDSPPVNVYTAHMYRALLFLLLTLATLPASVFAQGDSISAAINIVEKFQKEANILMRSAGLLESPDFMARMAVRDLEQARLTETSGVRRSERVYGIVNSFTLDTLNTFESRGMMLSGPERQRHAEAMKRLRDLRSEMLDRLRAQLSSEMPIEAEPEGVPSMDISPYDEEKNLPDGPPGILFR